MKEHAIKKTPPPGFFFSILLPMLFIIIGALILYFGFRNLERAMESPSWPTAQGRITQSSVGSHRNDEGGRTYHAEVLYKFKVNGTIFSSNRVAFGDYGSGDPSNAQSIVNRYPEGKNLTVYYMEDHPDISVLETGIKGQTWFIPGGGLLFLGAGIVLAFFSYLQNKPSADSAERPK